MVSDLEPRWAWTLVMVKLHVVETILLSRPPERSCLAFLSLSRHFGLWGLMVLDDLLMGYA